MAGVDFPPQLAWLQQAIAALVTETFTSVSSPVQYAAVVAFSDHPEITSYLERSRAIMKAVMMYSCEQLRSAGVHTCEPRGGFYLFPRFDTLQEAKSPGDSAVLCSRLLEETGVALLPGSDFGRPPQELSARLAGVDFDGAAALAALTAGAVPDSQFLRQYCANTVEGVDRLCQWVNSGF